jgi:hypothetical protein
MADVIQQKSPTFRPAGILRRLKRSRGDEAEAHAIHEPATSLDDSVELPLQDTADTSGKELEV